MGETDPNLLLEMRKATRRAHSIANALILSKLVIALTDAKLYAQALSSFLPVYQKLDQLMQLHAAVPGLSTVIAAVSSIPPRSEAMKSDLKHLLGSEWCSQLPSSSAAAAYADHLQRLADQDPVLLLPYVFSMHVPILLGFLGQRIQRTLQLPDNQGLAFFNVSGVLALWVHPSRTVVSVVSNQHRVDPAGCQSRRRHSTSILTQECCSWCPV